MKMATAKGVRTPWSVFKSIPSHASEQGWAMLPTGARFGSLSKLYIVLDPGAAHCWPISVHIRFGFKLYIFIIKTLTKRAFLSQTEHHICLDFFFSQASSL
jgi:hypothetical protein